MQSTNPQSSVTAPTSESSLGVVGANKSFSAAPMRSESSNDYPILYVVPPSEITPSLLQSLQRQASDANVAAEGALYTGTIGAEGVCCVPAVALQAAVSAHPKQDSAELPPSTLLTVTALFRDSTQVVPDCPYYQSCVALTTHRPTSSLYSEPLSPAVVELLTRSEVVQHAAARIPRTTRVHLSPRPVGYFNAPRSRLDYAAHTAFFASALLEDAAGGYMIHNLVSTHLSIPGVPSVAEFVGASGVGKVLTRQTSIQYARHMLGRMAGWDPKVLATLSQLRELEKSDSVESPGTRESAVKILWELYKGILEEMGPLFPYPELMLEQGATAAASNSQHAVAPVAGYPALPCPPQHSGFANAEVSECKEVASFESVADAMTVDEDHAFGAEIPPAAPLDGVATSALYPCKASVSVTSPTRSAGLDEDEEMKDDYELRVDSRVESSAGSTPQSTPSRSALSTPASGQHLRRAASPDADHLTPESLPDFDIDDEPQPAFDPLSRRNGVFKEPKFRYDDASPATDSSSPPPNAENAARVRIELDALVPPPYLAGEHTPPSDLSDDEMKEQEARHERVTAAFRKLVPCPHVRVTMAHIYKAAAAGMADGPSPTSDDDVPAAPAEQPLRESLTPPPGAPSLMEESGYDSQCYEPTTPQIRKEIANMMRRMPKPMPIPEPRDAPSYDSHALTFARPGSRGQRPVNRELFLEYLAMPEIVRAMGFHFGEPERIVFGRWAAAQAKICYIPTTYEWDPEAPLRFADFCYGIGLSEPEHGFAARRTYNHLAEGDFADAPGAPPSQALQMRRRIVESVRAPARTALRRDEPLMTALMTALQQPNWVVESAYLRNNVDIMQGAKPHLLPLYNYGDLAPSRDSFYLATIGPGERDGFNLNHFDRAYHNFKVDLRDAGRLSVSAERAPLWHGRVPSVPFLSTREARSLGGNPRMPPDRVDMSRIRKRLTPPAGSSRLQDFQQGGLGAAQASEPAPFKTTRIRKKRGRESCAEAQHAQNDSHHYSDDDDSEPPPKHRVQEQGRAPSQAVAAKGSTAPAAAGPSQPNGSTRMHAPAPPQAMCTVTLIERCPLPPPSSHPPVTFAKDYRHSPTVVPTYNSPLQSRRPLPGKVVLPTPRVQVPPIECTLAAVETRIELRPPNPSVASAAESSGCFPPSKPLSPDSEGEPSLADLARAARMTLHEVPVPDSIRAFMGRGVNEPHLRPDGKLVPYCYWAAIEEASAQVMELQAYRHGIHDGNLTLIARALRGGFQPHPTSTRRLDHLIAEWEAKKQSATFCGRLTPHSLAELICQRMIRAQRDGTFSSREKAKRLESTFLRIQKDHQPLASAGYVLRKLAHPPMTSLVQYLAGLGIADPKPVQGYLWVIDLATERGDFAFFEPLRYARLGDDERELYHNGNGGWTPAEEYAHLHDECLRAIDHYCWEVFHFSPSQLARQRPSLDDDSPPADDDVLDLSDDDAFDRYDDESSATSDDRSSSGSDPSSDSRIVHRMHMLSRDSAASPASEPDEAPFIAAAGLEITRLTPEERQSLSALEHAARDAKTRAALSDEVLDQEDMWIKGSPTLPSSLPHPIRRSRHSEQAVRDGRVPCQSSLPTDADRVIDRQMRRASAERATARYHNRWHALAHTAAMRAAAEHASEAVPGEYTEPAPRSTSPLLVTATLRMMQYGRAAPKPNRPVQPVKSSCKPPPGFAVAAPAPVQYGFVPPLAAVFPPPQHGPLRPPLLHAPTYLAPVLTALPQHLAMEPAHEWLARRPEPDPAVSEYADAPYTAPYVPQAHIPASTLATPRNYVGMSSSAPPSHSVAQLYVPPTPSPLHPQKGFSPTQHRAAPYGSPTMRAVTVTPGHWDATEEAPFGPLDRPIDLLPAPIRSLLSIATSPCQPQMAPLYTDGEMDPTGLIFRFASLPVGLSWTRQQRPDHSQILPLYTYLCNEAMDRAKAHMNGGPDPASRPVNGTIGHGTPKSPQLDLVTDKTFVYQRPPACTQRVSAPYSPPPSSQPPYTQSHSSSMPGTHQFLRMLRVTGDVGSGASAEEMDGVEDEQVSVHSPATAPGSPQAPLRDVRRTAESAEQEGMQLATPEPVSRGGLHENKEAEEHAHTGAASAHAASARPDPRLMSLQPPQAPLPEHRIWWLYNPRVTGHSGVGFSFLSLEQGRQWLDAHEPTNPWVLSIRHELEQERSRRIAAARTSNLSTYPDEPYTSQVGTGKPVKPGCPGTSYVPAGLPLRNPNARPRPRVSLALTPHAAGVHGSLSSADHGGAAAAAATSSTPRARPASSADAIAAAAAAADDSPHSDPALGAEEDEEPANDPAPPTVTITVPLSTADDAQSRADAIQVAAKIHLHNERFTPYYGVRGYVRYPPLRRKQIRWLWNAINDPARPELSCIELRKELAWLRLQLNLKRDRDPLDKGLHALVLLNPANTDLRGVGEQYPEFPELGAQFDFAWCRRQYARCLTLAIQLDMAVMQRKPHRVTPAGHVIAVPPPKLGAPSTLRRIERCADAVIAPTHKRHHSSCALSAAVEKRLAEEASRRPEIAQRGKLPHVMNLQTRAPDDPGRRGYAYRLTGASSAAWEHHGMPHDDEAHAGFDLGSSDASSGRTSDEAEDDVNAEDPLAAAFVAPDAPRLPLTPPHLGARPAPTNLQQGGLAQPRVRHVTHHPAITPGNVDPRIPSFQLMAAQLELQGPAYGFSEPPSTRATVTIRMMTGGLVQTTDVRDDLSALGVHNYGRTEAEDPVVASTPSAAAAGPAPAVPSAPLFTPPHFGSSPFDGLPKDVVAVLQAVDAEEEVREQSLADGVDPRRYGTYGTGARLPLPTFMYGTSQSPHLFLSEFLVKCRANGLRLDSWQPTFVASIQERGMQIILNGIVRFSGESYGRYLGRTFQTFLRRYDTSTHDLRKQRQALRELVRTPDEHPRAAIERWQLSNRHLNPNFEGVDMYNFEDFLNFMGPDLVRESAKWHWFDSRPGAPPPPKSGIVFETEAELFEAIYMFYESQDDRDRSQALASGMLKQKVRDVSDHTLQSPLKRIGSRYTSPAVRLAADNTMSASGLPTALQNPRLRADTYQHYDAHVKNGHTPLTSHTLTSGYGAVRGGSARKRGRLGGSARTDRGHDDGEDSDGGAAAGPPRHRGRGGRGGRGHDGIGRDQRGRYTSPDPPHSSPPRSHATKRPHDHRGRSASPGRNSQSSIRAVSSSPGPPGAAPQYADRGAGPCKSCAMPHHAWSHCPRNKDSPNYRKGAERHLGKPNPQASEDDCRKLGLTPPSAADRAAAVQQRSVHFANGTRGASGPSPRAPPASALKKEGGQQRVIRYLGRSRTGKRTVFVSGIMGGVRFSSAMVDTGAEVSAISSAFQDLHPQLRNTFRPTCELKLADGSSATIKGGVRCRLRLEDDNTSTAHEGIVEFLVLPTLDVPILLGQDILTQFVDHVSLRDGTVSFAGPVPTIHDLAPSRTAYVRVVQSEQRAHSPVPPGVTTMPLEADAPRALRVHRAVTIGPSHGCWVPVYFTPCEGYTQRALLCRALSLDGYNDGLAFPAHVQSGSVEGGRYALFIGNYGMAPLVLSTGLQVGTVELLTAERAHDIRTAPDGPYAVDRDGQLWPNASYPSLEHGDMPEPSRCPRQEAPAVPSRSERRQTQQAVIRHLQSRDAPAANSESTAAAAFDVNSLDIAPDLSASDRSTLTTALSGVLHTFALTPGRTPTLAPGVEHAIRIEGDPVKQAPYRLNPIKQQIVDSTVAQLLAQDLVRPSNSPWSSPVVLVPKHDGSWRMCIDYRRVNSRTRKDAYPIPLIDDCLSLVGDAEYLSLIDIKDAYHHVPMARESAPVTAFATARGLFEWNRMPFGLNNAPATFQRYIDSVLREHIGVRCAAFFDDCLVYTRSRSMADHARDVTAVLKCLHAAGLDANFKKCKFGYRELLFVGHVVSKGAVRPDPAKLAAVRDFPRPDSLTRLKSFLGLANYYHKFIGGFALIAQPLYALTRKGVPFEWNGLAQAAFAKLKDALLSAPCLAPPNFKKPFILQTDASKEGISGVLVQTDAEGVEHPVAFISRQLNVHEKNYSATEWECLGVVWAVGQFEMFLIDAPFTIVTDHSALRWLDTKRFENSRLMRWALKLSSFSYTVQHRAGKDNANADALSRCPVANSAPPEAAIDDGTPGISPGSRPSRFVRFLSTEREVPSSVAAPVVTSYTPRWVERSVAQHLQLPLLPLQWNPLPVAVIRQLTTDTGHAASAEGTTHRNDPRLDLVLADEGCSRALVEAQRTDPPTRLLIDCKTSGAVPAEYEESARRRLEGRAHNFAMLPTPHGDALYYCPEAPRRGLSALTPTLPRLVVPPKHRADIIRMHHNTPMGGHFGIKRTYRKVSARYYWPTQLTDCVEHVKSCDDCCREKLRRRTPTYPRGRIDDPTEPFELISMDLIEMSVSEDFRYVLVVIDHFTLYAVTVPLMNKSPMTIARALVEEVFSRYGCPKRLLSDRGSEFHSELPREVARVMHVKQLFTTAEHPQCNGRVERLNATLKEVLAALNREFRGQWIQALQLGTFAYNTSVSAATGYTPFYMLYGMEARTPGDRLAESAAAADLDVEVPRGSYAQIINENRHRAATFVQSVLAANNQKVLESNLTLARIPVYNVGDFVWLRVEVPGPREHLYNGPYLVVRKHGETTYIVRDHSSGRPVGPESSVHASRLAPYFPGIKPPASSDASASEPPATVAYRVPGPPRIPSQRHRSGIGAVTPDEHAAQADEDTHATKRTRAADEQAQDDSNPGDSTPMESSDDSAAASSADASLAEAAAAAPVLDPAVSPDAAPAVASTVPPVAVPPSVESESSANSSAPMEDVAPASEPGPAAGIPPALAAAPSAEPLLREVGYRIPSPAPSSAPPDSPAARAHARASSQLQPIYTPLPDTGARPQSRYSLPPRPGYDDEELARQQHIRVSRKRTRSRGKPRQSRR